MSNLADTLIAWLAAEKRLVMLTASGNWQESAVVLRDAERIIREVVGEHEAAQKLLWNLFVKWCAEASQDGRPETWARLLGERIAELEQLYDYGIAKERAMDADLGAAEAREDAERADADALAEAIDRERLADAQHEVWSSWMRWFFEVDSPERRERWKRQMNAKYAELSEPEKQADRDVLDEHMPWLRAALAAHDKRRKEIRT